MAFLASLLAQLLEPLIQKAVNTAFEQFKAYQTAQWKDELGAIQTKLSGTMTVEEKLEAARKLSDLINRLN